MKLFGVLLLIHIALWPVKAHSQPMLHAGLPYCSVQGLTASELFISGNFWERCVVSYGCYHFGSGSDSVLVCRKQQPLTRTTAAPAAYTLRFTAQDGPAYVHPAFSAVLRKTGALPAGTYKIFLTLVPDTTEASRSAVYSAPALPAALQKTFSYQVDTLLPATSPLRASLNRTLLPEDKSGPLSGLLAPAAQAVNRTAATATHSLDRAGARLERQLKAKGIISRRTRRGDREVMDLYCEDLFIGRYELAANQSLQAQVAKQQAALTAPVTSMANTELEGYRSLLSQARDMLRLKKEARELCGELALSGNWANDQEPGSGQDNNYYEFGFNGQMKDNEIAGVGNHVDFGERRMDTRIARLGWSIDPLWAKYAGQSPYSFAGNSPIMNVDAKGLTKTTYFVVNDQRINGKTMVIKMTAPGLISVALQHNSFYGSLSWNWHDYSVVNTATISKDGKVSYSSNTHLGDYRTNTLFNSEKIAQLDVNDWKTKDNGQPSGWIGTSSTGGGEDNKFNPSPGPDSKFVDYGTLLNAFKMAANSSGDGPGDVLEAISYLNAAVDQSLDNNKPTTPVKIDASKGSKSAKAGDGPSQYCKSCNSYIEDGDRTTNTPKTGEKVDTISAMQHN